MAKKIKNYVKDKQPKTLWNKIGPFVKLREYLASNITPDVYANERGLKTKIMEFFGQDVPKANVDDFSQNLWFRFLNQPNNLKEENGIVRIPDNIKSIISDRINGGWEKMAKKYGRELDSLDNKIIDGKVAGKDVSDLEELRDVTSRKLGMVEEGIDLLKKARTGEHQVFNEYNFIPDAYGDLNDLSGLSSFTMYRDDRGRMVVKDKYDFYRDDQPLGVGVVTKILDTIGYPFEIRDYVEDKIPYEENDPNKILLRSVIDSKNDLDKKMEIKSKKKEGGETDEEIFRKLYKEDIERVKNGEKAMFFGELNDIPIEEVHPELMLASRLSAVSGIIDGLDDIKKGEYAEAFASGLLGFVPFAAKKVASYINKEGLIRGVLKDFNETIDRFGNDVIKGEKYFPSNIKNRLSDKHNKEIMEIESAIGNDRLLHIRPERVNPNGTLGVRNLRYYTVDEFRRKSANGENSDLAKVWWAEDTPISYTGYKNTIVSIRKDLDKMDMKSQKYLGGRDNVHVSNSLDLRDPELDSKVYRAYYDDNFVPESHRIGPTVYKDGGVIKKQREAYEYFTDKRGMSKIQALAIIGNLMAESGLKDDIYGDNKTSYGIQQWHNERMDKLFKHAKKKGHSTPTFKDQLEFLADEYEGKTGYSNFLYTRKGKEGPGYYNYSRQDFMNAENLKDAVVAWNQGAGRPHKSVIRNDDRYNYAMEVAKNLGLEIEENSISSYGQMGFGDDGEIATSVMIPEVEVVGALPKPEAPSQEEQSEAERFHTWTETYGKDIIAHLMSLEGDNSNRGKESDMMYKQYAKESEEDKRRALIESILPSIQLKIKGVTD